MPITGIFSPVEGMARVFNGPMAPDVPAVDGWAWAASRQAARPTPAAAMAEVARNLRRVYTAVSFGGNGRYRGSAHAGCKRNVQSVPN